MQGHPWEPVCMEHGNYNHDVARVKSATSRREERSWFTLKACLGVAVSHEILHIRQIEPLIALRRRVFKHCLQFPLLQGLITSESVEPLTSYRNEAGWIVAEIASVLSDRMRANAYSRLRPFG